jgi:hexokinase
LRVGFVELSRDDGKSREDDVEPSSFPQSRVLQTHRSWPIGEHLKYNQAEDLFGWIGECIAEVLEADSRGMTPEVLAEELHLGVTFSFPMMYVETNS